MHLLEQPETSVDALLDPMITDFITYESLDMGTSGAQQQQQSDTVAYDTLQFLDSIDMNACQNEPALSHGQIMEMVQEYGSMYQFVLHAMSRGCTELVFCLMPYLIDDVEKCNHLVQGTLM